MKRLWRCVASVFTLVMCLGCGTIVTLSDNKQWPNQIYAGTRASALGHSTQIDLPFSLVADTIVLPYTIIRTIYNYTHVDTLFYDFNIKGFPLEIYGPTVLVLYSSIDNKSECLWPKLLFLANKKYNKNYNVKYCVLSLDKNKKDAAILVSKYKLPPFLLNWVQPIDYKQLKIVLESHGIIIHEPMDLPVVALFDSDRKLLKQWHGINDISEVDKAISSLFVH